MWDCLRCGRRIFVPFDDGEDLCLACIRKEQDERASSGAVRDGFWDRTAKKEAEDE